MLTNALSVIVNKLFLKSFDTTFIENIKNHKKKLITLSFSHKIFQK